MPEHTEARWVDYGADFYAVTSWDSDPHYAPEAHAKLALAWMSNWQYAAAEPTSPWRGAMTVPRTYRLCFERLTNRTLLCQLPTKEVFSLLEDII